MQNRYLFVIVCALAVSSCRTPDEVAGNQPATPAEITSEVVKITMAPLSRPEFGGTLRYNVQTTGGANMLHFDSRSPTSIPATSAYPDTLPEDIEITMTLRTAAGLTYETKRTVKRADVVKDNAIVINTDEWVRIIPITIEPQVFEGDLKGSAVLVKFVPTSGAETTSKQKVQNVNMSSKRPTIYVFDPIVVGIEPKNPIVELNTLNVNDGKRAVGVIEISDWQQGLKIDAAVLSQLK